MDSFVAQPLFLPATSALRFLPESPRILRSSPLEDRLLGWVAIQESAQSTEGSFNILRLRTLENEVHPLPGRPGFFAETDEPGVIVVGLERDLVLYDYRQRRLASERWPVTADPRVVINDGLAVPGGLLFGTKHQTFAEAIACIYYFDAASRQLHTLDAEQICANGKFLNGDWLVHIDSFQKTLDHFPISLRPPSLGGKRVIADFRQTPLFPDGMRPSADGLSVVVAFYNPEPVPYGLARQFRIADGEVLAEWQLPGSPRVTCPEIFEWNGGVGILFTTAVEGMDPVLPDAGAIYLADTPFAAAPAPPPLFPAEALLR